MGDPQVIFYYFDLILFTLQAVSCIDLVLRILCFIVSIVVQYVGTNQIAATY